MVKRHLKHKNRRKRIHIRHNTHYSKNKLDKHWWLYWIIIHTILITILYNLNPIITLNEYIKLLISGLIISIIAKTVFIVTKNIKITAKSYFTSKFILWILVHSLTYWLVTEVTPLVISNKIFLYIGMGILFYIITKLIRLIEGKNNSGTVWFIIIILIIILILSTLNLNIQNSMTDTKDSVNNIQTTPVNKTNLDKNTNKLSNIIKKCDDGTRYNKCSTNKPYYCENGNLIKYPEKCLCKYDEIYSNNICLDKYQTEPKEISLEYTLRGSKNNINFIVYNGLNSYLSSQPRSITYYITPPTYEEMELKFIFQEDQIKLIKPLINKIKEITSNGDDQARITISIVQNIPYDWDGFYNTVDNRYPYEVLYDKKGVCGEKSKLLVLLLKELGYETVLFNYPNHQSVGIKCPEQYDYLDSGYCFVESTTPSIITDYEGNYIETGKLGQPTSIYIVSEGISFNSVKEEYEDNLLYQNLINKGMVLSQSDYTKWENITNKYGFIFE